ncbi:hypothetical protein FHH43_09030 [Clostridium perfringens]|nr:hypothetical protein [Clostridium perfringens]
MFGKFEKEKSLKKGENESISIENLEGNFVEVLDKNEFRKKFNISEEWNINEITNKTIDFITNKSIEGSSAIKELTLVLKAYKIPIDTYLNFIESLKGLKFGNQDCKVIVAEEYKNFAKEIDEYDVDDIIKLEAKINQMNKLLEANKNDAENDMKGKVMLCITGGIVIITTFISGAQVLFKYFDYKTKKSKFETIGSCVGNVCQVVCKALECATHFKSK